MIPKALYAIPQPFLILLRLLSGLHLIFAAIPASSHRSFISDAFRGAAPLQISFLIFLSGYTLTHAHPQRAPPLFALRRLFHLLPLFVLANVLHAFCFSEAKNNLLPLLAEITCLAPYLPNAYAFSPHNAPTPAQPLIPSLIFSSIIYPSLRVLLPTSSPRNANSHLLAAVFTFFVLFLQSLWLVHLPDSRRTILPDILAYIPFLSYTPCFIAGMTLALWQISTSATRTLRSYLLLRIIVSISFLAAISRVVATNSYPFFRSFCISAAPLPFFALLLDSCYVQQPLLHSSQSEPYQRRSQLLLHLSHFSFSAFLLALPLYRTIAHLICNSADTAPLYSFSCFEPNDSHGVFGQNGLFTPAPVWDLSSATVEMAVVRSLSTSAVYEQGVRLPFFLISLTVLSCIVCRIFLAPMSRLADAICARIAATIDDHLLPSVLAFLHGGQKYKPPRRDISLFQRLALQFMYYSSAFLFMTFVYNFSQPVRDQMASKPHSFLCWLPDAIYKCQNTSSEGENILISLLQNPHARLIAKICQGISLLTLPTMFINVIGHVIYPRVIWLPLPSIPLMLAGQDQETNMIEEGQTRTEDSSNAVVFSEPLLLDFVLYIRYVTRGTNPRLMEANTRQALQVMYESQLPRHMWRIEIVTDKSLNLGKHVGDAAVYEIVVPQDYSPPNGAKYKARALNYAIQASPARSFDWIVHLDEETRFDCDTISAIMYHCGGESYKTRVAKMQKWPRIGQGAIVYGRTMTDHMSADGGNWLTTLADSGRVSDDCGRYRLQYECGEVWVGMHGSFVVVANCVEQEVTFDHGVRGSIAEDAFFAILARSKTVQFRWIDALMFEQSPFTMKDFIKQRSRWLVGGVQVVTSGTIPLRLRWVMGLLTWLWSLMPLTYFSLFAAILLSASAENTWWKHCYYYNLLPLLTAVSLWGYVFGFMVTFSVPAIGLVRYAVLLYAQIVLTPIFGLIEVSAVGYALLNFRRISTEFHVVQKDRVVGVGERQSLL